MLKFIRNVLFVFILLSCFACARRQGYNFHKYDNKYDSKYGSSQQGLDFDTQRNYQRAYKEIQENALEWNDIKIDGDIKEENAYRQYFEWELWGKDSDLKGREIENTLIKEGDELSLFSNFKGSLERYQRAKVEELSDDEKDALIARIASTELALDKPNDALSTISEYVKQKGISIEDVNKHYALILAYAYGRSENYDQAFAWFSKIYRQEQDRSLIGKSVLNGAKMLLSSVSNDDLEKLSNNWYNDSFVYNLIGIERQKRVASGKNMFVRNSEPFWENDEIKESLSVDLDQNKKIIAVLLPLSGKYKKLGENTKKGISLATSEMLSRQGYEINFFDTKGDAIYTENLVNQILQNQNVVMFLGPLLSDVSERISYPIRKAGIPILTFSKSDNLDLGYGMFRLGITPQTEINSLLSSLLKYRHVYNYAVVYPENEKGHLYLAEFKKVISNMQNLNLVYEKSYYPEDSNSLLMIASDLESRNVDAVFMPDNLRAASKFKYSMSPKLKSKLIVAGPSSWDNQSELILASAALNGSIFTSPFFDKDKRALVSKFVNLYQAKYKEKPDFLSAQGFDAITMIFASIKIALEESSSIEEAFFKIKSYNGLTGIIEVEENGDIHRALTVVEWKNRAREDLSTQPQVVKDTNNVFTQGSNF